jgi:hypothetical protein
MRDGECGHAAFVLEIGREALGSLFLEHPASESERKHRGEESLTDINLIKTNMSVSNGL